MSWLKSLWTLWFARQPEESERNLSPRAQQALAFAYKEAGRLNHNFVGTEHVLLGLIAFGQGTAISVLTKMGLQLDILRLEVEKLIGTGDRKVFGQIPYTPRVKKALALAIKESKALNHTYVGTEHLLLGLIREGDGAAARVLKNLGVDIENVRQSILEELDPNRPPRPEQNLPLTNPNLQGTETLEVMKRLIGILSAHCRDHSTLDELTQIIDHQHQWRAAHALFQRIRAKTLDCERRGDKMLKTQYLFEEVCAKTLYNLSGEPAPFDADSPFWIIPNALAAARHLGIDDKEFLKALSEG